MMPKRGDAIEIMCRAYWDSYRAGFLEVGGDTSYPTWDQFAEERAKAETRRCMRHAVEALLELPVQSFGPKANQKMEQGSFKALHARLFPNKPMRRKNSERSQTELQAEALNKANSDA
jgi:hypothetical protein